jgi:hypothetical protein
VAVFPRRTVVDISMISAVDRIKIVGGHIDTCPCGRCGRTVSHPFFLVAVSPTCRACFVIVVFAAGSQIAGPLAVGGSDD